MTVAKSSRSVKTGRITRAKKTPPAININAIVAKTDADAELHGEPPAWAEVSISTLVYSNHGG